MWLEEHGSDFAVIEDSFSALSSLAKSFVLIFFFWCVCRRLCRRL